MVDHCARNSCGVQTSTGCLENRRRPHLTANQGKRINKRRFLLGVSCGLTHTCSRLAHLRMSSPGHQRKEAEQRRSGSDLPPTTTLDRFIDANDERTLRRKRRKEQAEENTTSIQARPHRAVQYTVIGLEGAYLRKSHDPQNGRDHALSRRENRPYHQDRNVPPDTD
jgi:hypothetical protein